jgi:hypothetical protein
MKDCSGRFRQLIQGLLPNDARVLVPEGSGDIILLVTWKLNTDPARPSKRSRTIRLVISEEAAEDYTAGSDGLRLASDSRFLAWLRSRLDAFDPNHEAPLGVEPPAVTWAISTLELNG